MNIPFLNLEKEISIIHQSYGEKLNELILSGHLISGKYSERLEKSLESFLKVKNVILTQSCTDSLIISLLALDIKAGDDVLVSAFSFAATLNAILLIGAKPVFIDCNEYGTGFDFNFLDKALSDIKKIPKAAIGVHLFGHPFDTKKTNQILKKYQITLIEDSAQWFCENKKSENEENYIRCYSFDPSKNLFSLTPLGAIAIESDSLCKKIRILRNQGSRDGQTCPRKGVNSRPNEIASLFTLYNLGFFNEFEYRRESIIKKYNEICLELNVNQLKSTLDLSYSSVNKFIILSKKRDELKLFLKEKGVETKVHYPYTLPSLYGQSDQKFQNAKRLSMQSLSLPFYPYLSDLQISKIKDSLLDFQRIKHN